MKCPYDDANSVSAYPACRIRGVHLLGGGGAVCWDGLSLQADMSACSQCLLVQT